MSWTLESPRLTLRPCTEADDATLLDHWAEPPVRHFLFDDRIISLDTVEQIIQASSAAFLQHNYGLWMLSDKASGEFRGVCGLCASGLVELDLLFSIAPSAWRQGLATESAKRVLRYAFEDLALPQVTATVDQPNTTSIKVLKKLGLSLQEAQTIKSNIVLRYTITFESYFSRPTNRLLESPPSVVSQKLI